MCRNVLKYYKLLFFLLVFVFEMHTAQQKPTFLNCLFLEEELLFPTKGDSFKNLSPVCMSIIKTISSLAKNTANQEPFFFYKMGRMTKSFTWE